MRADSLEPYKKTFELVLPCENPLYGTEAFFKNFEVKHGFAATLILLPISFVGIDVRFHACIEDFLTVFTAIIDPIEAHGGSFNVEPYSFCNTLQWAHCFAYEGRLILVAWREDHRCYNIAVTIT